MDSFAEHDVSCCSSDSRRRADWLRLVLRRRIAQRHCCGPSAPAVVGEEAVSEVVARAEAAGCKNLSAVSGFHFLFALLAARLECQLAQQTSLSEPVGHSCLSLW